MMAIVSVKIVKIVKNVKISWIVPTHTIEVSMYCQPTLALFPPQHSYEHARKATQQTSLGLLFFFRILVEWKVGDNSTVKGEGHFKRNNKHLSELCR